MRKRTRKKVLIGLLSVVVSLGAAVPSRAEKAPDTKREVSLEVVYTHDKEALKGRTQVYKIADMRLSPKGEVVFDTVPSYKDVHEHLAYADLEKGQALTKDFERVLDAKTLVGEEKTDGAGLCAFPVGKLQSGLYLVKPTEFKGMDIEPFLISLPLYAPTSETTEDFIYHVVCHPKSIREKEEPKKDRDPDPGLETPEKDKDRNFPFLPRTGLGKVVKKLMKKAGLKLPKTGDESAVVFYVFSACGAAALMALCLKKRKK